MAFNTTSLVTLMEAIPTILAPIPDIIIVVIEIMAYMAVGGLIVGVLGGIVIAIRSGLDMKKGLR